MMIMRAMIEGKRYKHRKYGYFRATRIESVENGQILDMGIFRGIDPKTDTQGENTHNVRIEMNGKIMHYTETKGAIVRVWEESH